MTINVSVSRHYQSPDCSKWGIPSDIRAWDLSTSTLLKGRKRKMEIGSTIGLHEAMSLSVERVVERIKNSILRPATAKPSSAFLMNGGNDD